MEETKKKSARRSSIKKTPAKNTTSKKDKSAEEVVKEAEEQCWPWEIKHPVPFEKQTDQNIVQIQDDH